MTNIDKETKEKLINGALEARKKSYSPYSKYPVGAAVIAGSGKMYTGCNIENSSFGLTNCAERTAIFKAVSEGEKSILAIAIAAKSSAPCGACRQVLSEFAAAEIPVLLVNIDDKKGTKDIQELTLGELLPFSFNQKDAGLC